MLGVYWDLHSAVCASESVSLDFGGDGSRDCCITMECEALGLQHTVKAFRLVHSNGERLLSICIFENLFNMNTAGYLLVMKTAVVGMIWVFFKKPKQTSQHY